ncbi:hypothetical protein GOODEAATRI_006883 [Goodea atripinnis]|uniref:Uncharacterized protein n=1 Tax=Goodea atripinnis TaxID=208336 RepID=A0ABV0PBZ7_9TELE
MCFTVLSSVFVPRPSHSLVLVSVSHTAVISPLFPPRPDSSWLVVVVAHFSCQSFPCRKHQAVLGFSHMNKQASQSSPVNILISLASLSLGSLLGELVVYVSDCFGQ